MSSIKSPLPRDVDTEISELIETLHKTGQRLEELTAGEVDTVAGGDGQTLLMRRAHDHLRRTEEEKQAAILNGLPAHIALLDSQGVILSVNETWRRSIPGEVVQGPGHLIGLNYLDICDGCVPAGGSNDAHLIADGIRSVLDGRAKSFSTEYPCHTATDHRWFLLTATPRTDDRRSGAIVMQLDVTAERRAEESLRSSELRFRQMAENSRDVFFLTDLDGTRVHYASPAYERIWGRTSKSLIDNPQSWAASIHPDDRERIFAENAAAASSDTFDYTYRIIRPDGNVRWVRVRGFPVFDDDGKRYRTAVTAEDITERKRNADELQESQRRFSDVLANVDMASLMLDTNAHITYCNDYLLELTGWRREELIGQDWFERFLPSDSADLRIAFAALLDNQPAAHHLENEILTRSGKKRLIQWNNTVLRSAAGKVIGIASIGQDITERKQVEARMRLQSAALNASANAMIITGRDLSIVWMNPAFHELTGYSAEEALGRNVNDLLSSGVHDEAFYKDIVDTIFAGESWSGEITNRRKDGRLYPEATVITPVKDDDGTITHFVSVKSDLTAQRQMEAQLRQGQKMEAVGQLAAGVAHEFNNLLQALMSMAAIMRLRAVDPEVAKIGTEMELQIKRGAGITQQLLLFSQRRAIKKSHLDVREQIQKASVLLQRLIPENIRIVVETSPDRLSVEGDAGEIQQVLLNFAINARDAMPDGGILTLRAGLAGGEVFLEIEDSGEGMDEATRAHIFEPFFTTKEVGKGTGLGLAVVHGIVQQHGGRIEVSSRPGSGSRFRVILPASVSDGAPVSQPTAGAELPAGSGRVLLVEDEEDVRAGIATLLEMIGYEVTAVDSGEKAIAVPLEPAPDLLLCDVTLPGMTGSVLGDRLLDRWPALKVVLMSGYIADALRADASARGWHFLQKPFELTDLASHLRAALERKMVA